MIRHRRHLLALAAASSLGLPGLHAAAQGGAAPARILVGFSAGGSFDATARLLAEKLRSELKRPVLVENRPGAGGRLAMDVLRSAPRDGSVVMLGPDALVALYPYTLRKLSYDPRKDLVPIGTVSEFPFSLVVGATGGPRTLAEYVSWARAHPAQANYGVPARGAPHHFFGITLGQGIGVDLQDVPFQGSAPMLVGVIGQQVSAGIDVMGSVLEQHRSGKLRMLAVSSQQRMPQAPDVPTFAELGYKGITGMGFNALYAPAGTPAEAVAAWSRALGNVLAMPDVREQLAAMGVLPVGKGPEELAARGAEAAARWEPVIRASGFQGD
ncbi:Bug family tripartite tricarboxylate transporter substrate binding protein [Azohydromonas aeria]|uniref:Bug family tripartite tricarboxylate transporter substrate binding protein n=1 Tax=Azohydromonas aeria TaxID=2590212 RepID=UPI0012FB86CE|nr:Bug family tripartite tricarboxylate transporter substrate binding protein [Azohydromonas aeria]